MKSSPLLVSHETSLDALRRGLAAMVSDNGPDLTARQLQMLLTVTLTPGPHTVRGLAAALVISKPAITRATDRLVELGFVTRRPDPKDRRSVIIAATRVGRDFLGRLAAGMSVAEPLGDPNMREAA